MSAPQASMIPRTSPKTQPDDYDTRTLRPADWDDVQARLRKGPWPFWLSVTIDGAPHVRPVFAAWTGDAFIHASNPGARKTVGLRVEGPCSVAVDLRDLHLVVEGEARRLRSEPDLRRAIAAFDEVFNWPTEISGDLLDAPYAAPTSGGPPFEAYEIRPVKAYGFPTEDQFEPTRFDFK
ncbi:pyridoxamine 5'-phosphate oxidase [Cryptosporangium sp. NPDC048952]|uniref:pyridoxamine 5'-phosphate oxidase n=1 Tax=Cryptosporangium sp. NPDC048952 TaxID=3363961 RepID=UPI003722EDF0